VYFSIISNISGFLPALSTSIGWFDLDPGMKNYLNNYTLFVLQIEKKYQLESPRKQNYFVIRRNNPGQLF
jgi:hypothetical protein